MDAKDTLNKVRAILGLDISLEEKLLENGTKFVAEKFQAGDEVFIATDEDEKIPVPAGEYMMEDGQLLVVKEDGLIDEIRDGEEDEEEDEEMGYDDKEEMEEDEADVADWKGMEKRIKNLEDAIADLKGENKEDLSDEVEEEEQPEELSAETENLDQKNEVELSVEKPETPEIKHNPESKQPIELTKIGKVSGLRQRVFDRIFNDK